MTWVKIDDTFPESPQALDAGPAASWLHVAALAYCNRHLTDGSIPLGMLDRLTTGADALELAERLVAVGLWKPGDTGDSYEIVDYLLSQPSRAKVEKTRRERAKAGQIGGRRSGQTRRSTSQAKTKQVASRSVEPRPVASNEATTGARRRCSEHLMDLNAAGVCRSCEADRKAGHQDVA